MCHVVRSTIIVITISPNSGPSQVRLQLWESLQLSWGWSVLWLAPAPVTWPRTSMHGPQCHAVRTYSLRNTVIIWTKGRNDTMHGNSTMLHCFAHLVLLFFSFSSINSSLSIMQQSTVTTNEWYCNAPSLYQWWNITVPPNITEPLRKYHRFVSFSNTWLSKKCHKMHAVLLPLSHRALGSW
jgi:hypothetical protein